MNISPHTTILCHHCYREFRVPAWRINPGSSLDCTCCGNRICINENDPEHRMAIEYARGANDLFQARRTDIRPRPLVARSDAILARLEQLARQLDELASR